jgi:hypothetical protein
MKKHLPEKYADKLVIFPFHAELQLQILREYILEWPFGAGKPRDSSLDLPFLLYHVCDHNVFLGLEVVVDGSFAQVGHIGDVFHGDLVDAMTGKELHGRSDDPGADGRLLFLTADAYDFGHL